MLKRTLDDTRDEEVRNVGTIEDNLAATQLEFQSQLLQFDEMHANAKAAILVGSVDVGTKEEAFAKSVDALSAVKAEVAKTEMDLKHADLEVSSSTSDLEQLRDRSANSDFETDASSAVTEDITARLHTLVEAIAEATRARKTLALKLQVAKDSLGAATTEQDLRAKILAEAQSVLRERTAAVNLARAEILERQKAATFRMGSELEVAKRRLAAFEHGPHAAFKQILRAIEVDHGEQILSELTQ